MLRILFVSVLVLFISCSNEKLDVLDWELITNYKKVNIFISNYCIESEKEYIDIYASNYSAKLKDGKLLIDFDRDGLPNAFDSVEEYAISPFKYDTNSDGYRDLLVYLSGIDIHNQQYLKLCESMEQDTDGDGLTDCEENNMIRSDYQNFDTDGDGIPDELEIMNDLNPNDPNDAYQDLDDDGLINSEEVRRHTPIDFSNTKNTRKIEYEYVISLLEDKNDENRDNDENNENKRCYDIHVNNITLVDVRNGNLIKFNIIEKLFNEKLMRTFRVIIEYDKVKDNELLEYDFESLVEGV